MGETNKTANFVMYGRLTVEYHCYKTSVDVFSLATNKKMIKKGFVETSTNLVASMATKRS